MPHEMVHMKRKQILEYENDNSKRKPRYININFQLL